jgi:L-2,4-diaminobutyrate decarboxylase
VTAKETTVTSKIYDLIYSGASPDQVKEDLLPLLDFQEEGIPMQALSRMVTERLTPHLVQYSHPAFHSLYNFFPEKGALLGGGVALRYNQGVTNWQVSPGGVMLEELCLQALCRLFEFPHTSDATFMYCGTYANQQALYLALHRHAEAHGFDLAQKGLKGFSHPERLAVVVSQDAHFSLKHAVRSLGLGEDSLVVIPSDAKFRLDVQHLRLKLPELKKMKDIFCIVTTAGTTSTGTIEPILPLIEISRDIGAWLHVDGAYGFAYSLLPELKILFIGSEQADSVAWDPHKQFGVPIPNSVLFLQRKSDFERMAIYGEYFNRKDDPEPNPGLKSPPSTRPLSALPLVTTLRYLGLNGIRARLRAPLQAIQSLAEELSSASDIQVCNQPQTGILCLRYLSPHLSEKHSDGLQRYLYDRTKTEGIRSISMTRIADKLALRLVAISPTVTFDSLWDTVEYLRKSAQEYKPA